MTRTAVIGCTIDVTGASHERCRSCGSRVISIVMRTAGAIVSVIVALAACSKSAEQPPSPTPASASATAATPAPGTMATEGRPRQRKHEDRHDPAVAAPALQLAVAVDGAAATWQPDAFARVAQYTGNKKASDGEAREVWSLRDLVHALVGPAARVTAVTGDDGTKVITAAAWGDPSRTPLLHTTRRGTLKFRWAGADGAWGDTEIKDVTRIEIAK